MDSIPFDLVPVLIIAVLAIVILVGVISLYNTLVQARNAMRQARHGIDVALTQRHDLLTKQMQVVPEAVRSEQAFQEAVIGLRMPRPAEQMSVAELEQADQAMDRAQRVFRLTAEAYPEFRGSAAFQELQDSIIYTEEQLSAARRSYNAAVARLDDRRQMFPSNIVAALFGFRAEPMFRAEERHRDDVDLSGLREALARDRERGAEGRP